MNVYSKKIPTVIKFMEWYFQPEQQKRYAKVCQTGLKSVLDSPDWQSLNSYNKSFARALSYVNDYWHLPEYPELLDILQEEISAARFRQEDGQAGARLGCRTAREAIGKSGLQDNALGEYPGGSRPNRQSSRQDQVVEESYD